MIPTNDELLMFMKAVYDQTEGKFYTPVNMWEIGEGLGWEREKTSGVEERLADKGLIEPFALGGMIVLPLGGLEFCEDTFEPFEGRQENRLRLLRALYEETEGSGQHMADIWSVGESLGLDKEETTQAYYYLSKKDLFDARGIGGMTSLTQYGIDFVEQELLHLENFEEAVTRTEEAQPEGIPHTREHRYAFFSIDVVESSRLNWTYRTADVSQTLDAFKTLVSEQTESKLGELDVWVGDGGLALFWGEGCQQRSFDAAQMVLQRLRQFNEIEKRIPEPLRVRIAVHTGFFEMPDDPRNIHDPSVDLVTRLQQETEPNSIVVTSKVYKELDDSTKERLEHLPQPDSETGAALYCYRLPEEGN